MSTFTERMIGAARLDAAIYEEVEKDENALGQAAGVVALSSIAAGIGGFGGGLIGGTIAALLSWLIWALLTWAVGTKLLPEENTDADIAQLMRAIGFAAAPGLLRVLGFAPVVGPLIVLIANIWMLVAMVVAVRQALDYSSTGRAVGVCFVGFIVLILIQGLLLGVMGAGI